MYLRAIKVLLIVVGLFFTTSLSLLLPVSVVAQGTFTCRADSGQIVDDRCDGGYKAVGNYCTSGQEDIDGFICNQGGTCTFNCVPNEDIIEIGWGESCGNNGQPAINSVCSLSQLTCRADSDQNLRCLLPRASVNASSQVRIERSCADSTECTSAEVLTGGAGASCVVARDGNPSSFCFNPFDENNERYFGFADVTTGQIRSACPQRNGVYDCSDVELEDLIAGRRPSNASPSEAFRLCSQIPNDDLANQCRACAGADPDDPNSQVSRQHIWTGFGCISTNPGGLVDDLFTIAFSIAGGVAFVLIIAAGFMFTTSQGDPKRVSDARELAGSAIIGLLFIIFSVAILQFIGVDILKIPGFGG